MGFADKMRDKVQQLSGKSKETAGDKTGNDRLKAQGQSDQTKGNLKEAGENVKDAFDK